MLNQKAYCSNDPGASVPEMGASADHNNGIVELHCEQKCILQ